MARRRTRAMPPASQRLAPDGGSWSAAVKWGERELQILRDGWQKISLGELEAATGKSRMAIHRQAKRSGLCRLEDGLWKVSRIAADAGISKASVIQWIARLGLKPLLLYQSATDPLSPSKMLLRDSDRLAILAAASTDASETVSEALVRLSASGIATYSRDGLRSLLRTCGVARVPGRKAPIRYAIEDVTKAVLSVLHAPGHEKMLVAAMRLGVSEIVLWRAAVATGKKVVDRKVPLPPEVWDEALRRWLAMSPEERRAVRRHNYSGRRRCHTTR